MNILRALLCMAALTLCSTRSHELASELYQQIAQEACEAVGIPPIPVYKESNPKEEYNGATVFVQDWGIEDHYVLVNEYRLDSKPYTYKKYVLCHEMVHYREEHSKKVHSDNIRCIYDERYADLSACVAMNCFECITIVADVCLASDWKRKEGKGYLSPSELHEISQEYERDNRICAYHHNKCMVRNQELKAAQLAAALSRYNA